MTSPGTPMTRFTNRRFVSSGDSISTKSPRCGDEAAYAARSAIAASPFPRGGNIEPPSIRTSAGSAGDGDAVTTDDGERYEVVPHAAVVITTTTTPHASLPHRAR